MSAISELGCIVCRMTMSVTSPSEVHHLYGKTKPDSHLFSIPLCYLHHRAGEDNDLVTSRHPHKRRFEARYGTEEELLQRTRELIDG